MNAYEKKLDLIMKILKILGRTIKLSFMLWVLIMIANMYFRFADPYKLLAIISSSIVLITVVWLGVWGYVEKRYKG
ncbi:MAG: hypothetical protein ACD_3C00058G0003 [uncultured bacterium (gcode 4)]|uniref:Uncharacterized protein n=1 Tax=uncultured bacterium (gcode 4) TaxID=1234023 RepID=K2G2F6_9BACT|nr:MAG: hypothetical protein ACD_3C00058G0003 [uncultured bacterium (gcode 4)]